MIVLAAYSISALLSLTGAFVIFRILVRREYQRQGYLSRFTSFLELLIWVVYACFPYIYNPPDWWLVWFADSSPSPVLKMIGSVLTTIGMGIAVIAMAGLGFGITMGQKAETLRQTGLYRLSRNPQLMGGALAVVGIALMWPSWYALGWMVQGGLIGHMMVLTEEKHLRKVHGEAYVRYCERVPRYLGLPKAV